VITIKLKRRLLATAVMGIALVACAVLVVSMNGDDKPVITTNPPPADEEPQDAQVNPTTDAEALSPPEDDQDDPAPPGNDEKPGDNGEDDPVCEGKAFGLQTAIQAHVEAKEKTAMKGMSTPSGLENSLQLLTEMYAGVVAGDRVAESDNGHNR